MVRITRFEEIKSWEESQHLCTVIYFLCKKIPQRDISSQLLRAALSISNNIAEGFERNTNKEFINFLYIAKGSCGEVRSILYLLKDIKLISEPDFASLHQQCLTISELISALITYLQQH